MKPSFRGLFVARHSLNLSIFHSKNQAERKESGAESSGP